MVRLEHGDFEAVLDIVRTVSAARDPDEFSRRVVVAIAGLIPSDVVTINEVDPEAGRTVYMAEPESFPIPPDGEEILAALADQHPLISNFVATGDGSAHRMTDFCTQDEFHASALYQRLYRPMGVEYQMAVVLPAPRPVVLGIALNRSDIDFSERERALRKGSGPPPHAVERSHGRHGRQRGRVDRLVGPTARVDARSVGFALPVLWPTSDDELVAGEGRAVDGGSGVAPPG
jgi:hypothetical protein